MNLDTHPCFNVGAHQSYGRVHLPVAPRCNIQCKFCNRKFDCVNETRPGVTSSVLSPEQAMAYLEEVFKMKKKISVVGIAGPGDPFANPKETMETLRRVRETYPEVLLCVATNGLNLLPYIDELAALKVTHVTVTVNAIDPAVGKEIYSWIRYNKRVLRADEGAKILLEHQLAAIAALKEKGIMVKINAIIIPGVNDQHIEQVAAKMGEMDVDILNCVPYYPCSGSAFEAMAEPDPKSVEAIRKKASVHVKQMRHCKRCRADAVGLLGESMCDVLAGALKSCEQLAPGQRVKPERGQKPRVAVASMEGLLVNQHLGEADQILIFEHKNGETILVEGRRTPPKGLGDQRWESLADTLHDCSAILVSGVGGKPQTLLKNRGIDVIELEGMIDDAVSGFFKGDDLKYMMKRTQTACGQACSGTGAGCG